MKYLSFVILCIFFTCCDPALRLKIINDTSMPVVISLDKLQQCNTLMEYMRERSDSVNQNLVIATGEENSHIFYLGLGGWQNEDLETIPKCLDSLIRANPPLGQIEGRLSYQAELKEFSNSLLVYRIIIE